MLNKYLALWALAAVLVTLIHSPAVSGEEVAAEGQPIRLPPIWDSSYDDYYHLVSEIRLPEERASFLSEEWAASELASFRWDLSRMDSAGSKRKTILVNDKTNERFHFEPFNCQPIGNLSSALSPKLANLFPSNEHKFVMGGLGAIWLRAYNSAKQLFRPAKQRRLAATASGGAATAAAATSSMPLGYDEIRVEADAKFAYSIAVYFHEGHLERPIPKGGADLSFRQKSAVALVLTDPQNEHRPVLSARIIEFWHSEDEAYKADQQAALFELPAGYGCTRAPFKLNEPAAGASLYAPPANCFRRDGQPHAFDLQVSALLPSQTEHDLDKWAAHSSFVRVLRGELAGRQYVVVKRQDFAPARSRTLNGTSQPLLATRERSPRRLRRVWDLGAPGEHSSAPGGGGGFHFADQLQQQQQEEDELPARQQAGLMFYELDEARRACSRFETARAADEAAQVATVEFPVLTNEGQRVEAGLALTEELLRKLFESTANYQPIYESKDYWLSARWMVHERREDLFELHDKRGQRVWVGPVSIVRQFMKVNFEHAWRAKRADDLQVRVDLRMYSAHYAQLVGRVHLTLSPGQLLDAAQFHRELNIEPCLELGAASSPGVPRSSSGLEFQLNYVVADTPASLFGELAANGRLEELVYAGFIENLARLGAHQAAGAKPLVDPLQVSSIRVEVDKRAQTVSITGRVHQWPHLFNFDRKAALRFADGSLAPAAKRSMVVVLAGKANAELCAESCAHYACDTFSYCQDSSQCQIVVPAGEGADQTTGGPKLQLSFEADESCAIYAKRADRLARRPVSPAEFVHLHEQLISSASIAADNKTSCPLLMEFDVVELDSLERNKSKGQPSPATTTTDQASPSREKRIIQLIPSSIVAPVKRRAAELDFAPADWLANSSPNNLDYQVLFSRKKFKPIRRLDEETFPLPEANHVVSYEDCETLCRQNDCRSFSYCRLERTCTISRLHKTEMIEANAEPADACRLLALDYLSKFSRAETTHTGFRSTKTIPATRRASSSSSHDCAISCMEEARFKCRSFAYCKPASSSSASASAAGAEPNCLLRKSRSVGALQEQPKGDETGQTGALSDQFSCQMYTRSYLADFNRFYGHRLTNEPVNQQVRLLSPGQTSDAESCAAKCVDSGGSLDTARCRAFHVCRSDRRLTCATMVETATPATKAVSTSTNSTRKLNDWLVPADACTAFLLTREAQSTGGGGGGAGEQQADEQYEQTLDDVSMGGDAGSVVSRLAQCLFVVLGGLTLGYSASWLIARSFQTEHNLGRFPRTMFASGRQ